jgi:hypothetical protein
VACSRQAFGVPAPPLYEVEAGSHAMSPAAAITGSPEAPATVSEWPRLLSSMTKPMPTISPTRRGAGPPL